MARDTDFVGANFRISGGKEIVAALAKIDDKVTKRLSRGAIGEAANTIRNVAILTARGIGLSEVGPATTASGRKIIRHGMIPPSLYAYVMKSSRSKVTAIVGVDSRISESGRSAAARRSASHWVFVELGSAKNPPRPFLRPALIEGAQLAIDACIEVLERGISRYNVPGGGG